MYTWALASGLVLDARYSGDKRDDFRAREVSIVC